MEINRIATLLESSFSGSAWHGPSVLEALGDVSHQKRNNSISGSHTIIQLVAHMTSWRTFVTKRLLGDNTYEVTNLENFPKITNWEQTIADLKESQTKLLVALREFPEAWLYSTVPTRKYDFYSMLHGIIQHDIYHTGQIILLKK